MQFTNRSQEFLGGVFYRFPQIEGAFRHYESLPPAGRMHRAELQSQTIARRIWTELGIDPQDCETLSEHTARMLFLFKRYPAPRFDKDELQQQIMVWAVPRVLADELPLELMGWEDRHRLRLLAIDMVFESSPARADRARVMLTPRDPEGRSYDDESAFVNDLDFYLYGDNGAKL